MKVLYVFVVTHPFYILEIGILSPEFMGQFMSNLCTSLLVAALFLLVPLKTLGWPKYN